MVKDWIDTIILVWSEIDGTFRDVFPKIAIGFIHVGSRRFVGISVYHKVCLSVNFPGFIYFESPYAIRLCFLKRIVRPVELVPPLFANFKHGQVFGRGWLTRRFI